MKMKFYKCKVCGQIVAMVKDTNAPITCCGAHMEQIKPQENEDLVGEKHIPVYKVENNKIVVKIGSIPHPSTKDHFIEWVALVTNKGNQRKMLKPGEIPEASFCLDNDEIVEEIYAYCNIHSLWKLKVKEEDFRNKKKCGCIIDSRRQKV